MDCVGGLVLGALVKKVMTCRYRFPCGVVVGMVVVCVGVVGVVGVTIGVGVGGVAVVLVLLCRGVGAVGATCAIVVRLS